MSSLSPQFGATIVAQSTPPGFSGIGVIRMSGPDSLPILKTVFRRLHENEEIAERHAVYGHIVDPDTGEVIDDGIALVMRGPFSYTGEDLVELSLHGSPVILDTVIRILVRLGARMANRGEFTRRAYLNGRLSLIQAEAVIDLIEATSLSGVKEAGARLRSELSSDIRELSNRLKDIVVELEAYIDFDEDEEGPVPMPQSAVRETLEKMEALMSNAEHGRVRREGIRVVISGKPNVGKSTLFNALLKSERMIVTPHPGTTRDPVDERLILEGIPFVVSDTAGIRDNPEPIEEEGIRRTSERIDSADVVVAVLDGAAGPDSQDREVLKACRERPTVVVLNKTDLGLALETDDSFFGPHDTPRLALSAKTGVGLAELEQVMVGLGRDIMDLSTLESPAALNRRCLMLVEAATIPLRDLLHRWEENEPTGPEIVSLELRRALENLEEVTGERADEGVLERIFERFCVGK